MYAMPGPGWQRAGPGLLERVQMLGCEERRYLGELQDENDFSRHRRAGNTAIQFISVASSKVFWEEAGMQDGGGGEELDCPCRPAS